MRKHLITAAIGVTAVAAALAIPASAALPAPVAGVVTVLPGTTRVVPVPGRTLTKGATTVVQVTGTAAGQAAPGTTGVVVKLTSVSPTGTGSLVVHAHGTGAPGNPTVAFTKGTENSATTFVALDSNGQLDVTDQGAPTRFLLEVDGQITPAAPAPAAATFAVGQVQVDGATWAQYETAELGAPGGDQASGTVRFSCKNATDGCDVSLKAYSTGDGYTIYPRLVLEKEDNTTGAKLTCEYADGADNDGATFALTGTPATVPLGIGSTADCGGSQTVSGAVTSINVPGAAGQGIHYDAFTTLTFARSVG